MKNSFHMTVYKHNHDLHIRPVGDFNGSSALELLNLLHDQYDGKGRVFIDTARLCEVCPFGTKTFQCRLDRCRIPVHRLCFQGEKGSAIAPDGSVILKKPDHTKCPGKGNCKTCKCREKADVMLPLNHPPYKY